MTSALVVSRYFPSSAQQVHGVFQRLGTQVEALASVVDSVRCLFLVSVNENCAPDLIRAHEERLRRLWSPAVSLQLAPTVTGETPMSWWRLVMQGMLDFQRQPMARNFSTAAAVDAVSAALEARPHVVLAHRLTSMGVLMNIARQAPQRLQRVPVFFDMDDLEHVALVRHLLREPAWPAERLLLLQLPALVLAEIRAARLASATFVCSQSDRRRLARLSRTSRVRVVPNSVSFPAVDEADRSEPLVLFVGAMNYRPNAQAADLLVRDVWPAVRARSPAARLAIIGSAPERAASFNAVDESVTFTGFVEDLPSWYRRARVVCCPIHQGGGTRVKIIEAAAYAKAIVSTRLGAEGLDFEDGHEILLRDSPPEIAAACVRLLNDSNAAAQLGRAARQKARRSHERSAVVRQLAEIFRTGRADGERPGVPA